MLAYPEAIPGVRLGEELGVPRAAVDVLIGKATSLDLPLTWAVSANRVEKAARLRRPDQPQRQTTELERPALL
jgi:hypothetical protein